MHPACPIVPHASRRILITAFLSLLVPIASQAGVPRARDAGAASSAAKSAAVATSAAPSLPGISPAPQPGRFDDETGVELQGIPGPPIPIGVEGTPGGTLDEAVEPTNLQAPGSRSGPAPLPAREASGEIAPARAAPALTIAPNPASATTRFQFALDRATEVTLEVYDLLGRRVATPLAGRLPAGAMTVTWNLRRDDGGAVGPGLYFARLRTPDRATVRRVTVVAR